MLLLLLDLLLGGVLGLISPADGGAHDALNIFIRVSLVHNLQGEYFLREILILVEVEADGESFA